LEVFSSSDEITNSIRMITIRVIISAVAQRLAALLEQPESFIDLRSCVAAKASPTAGKSEFHEIGTTADQIFESRTDTLGIGRSGRSAERVASPSRPTELFSPAS
jgi:hypothetical protein